MSGGRLGPARRRLAARSRRIGADWIRRGLRGGGWPDPRGAIYRLLVPLEPWRVYELPRVASAAFAGACLDVSSPKLLASTLAHEGAGRWVAVDLLEDEIARWRRLDPGLDLRVEDARRLDLPDAAFDAVVCVSVIEHVDGDGDAAAMAEMWRVLRPDGVLHLTTNVGPRAGEVHATRPVYAPGGEDAPGGAGGRHFFERRYTDATLAERLLGLPWQEEEREYVVERLPLHRWFFAARPLSFLAGNLLPLACARNFRRVSGSDAVPEGSHGVVYLRLRRPA